MIAPMFVGMHVWGTQVASYHHLIRRLAPEANPRHVEAWMLSKRATLDDLPADRFRHEVLLALTGIAEYTPQQLEALARSYGL